MSSRTSSWMSEPNRNARGKVFLVGAGPGDPELLTIKAARAIASADVVVYDYLVNPEVLLHCRQGVELIYAGKQSGAPSISQEAINQILVDYALAGRTVVRLKGGDPFVFGRGAEEAEKLTDAGIDWEVIPGISSGIAAPAFAGIPLTHRDLSSTVMFIAGHEAGGKQRQVDWAAVSRAADTLVIFMCSQTISKISAELIAAGLLESMPIAIIRWGSYEQQETFTGTLAEASMIDSLGGRIPPPAIAIVGDVVSMRDKLKWFRHEVERRLAAETEALGDLEQLVTA